MANIWTLTEKNWAVSVFSSKDKLIKYCTWKYDSIDILGNTIDCFDKEGNKIGHGAKNHVHSN